MSESDFGKKISVVFYKHFVDFFTKKIDSFFHMKNTAFKKSPNAYERIWRLSLRTFRKKKNNKKIKKSKSVEKQYEVEELQIKKKFS